MASLSKTWKTTQNLYTSPFPLPLEDFPVQNPLPVEHPDSSRVPRNSRIDPTIANIFGRRTSMRRRPSSRLNDVHSTRGSPFPVLLAQSTGNTGKMVDLHNRGVATSKGMRPPTSPIPKQSSSRGTVRTSLMKRLTRRLQSPHSLEEADPASLPIQRVSSTRRRSIRVSSTHRASCKISARNSGLRSPSARFSRTPSGIQGSASSSRSPSVILGGIGIAALDDHSSYTTDSEQEEQPITMRSHRLERERATAMAPTSLAQSERMPVVARVPSHDSVADLIEQVAGRIDGRISLDTMSSIYDFSVNDYCNAFPAPPTPGTAPDPLWATNNINYTEQIYTDVSPLSEPVADIPFTPLTHRGPTLRTPTSHPSLGASNAELKLQLTLRTSASWDDWSTWPSPPPAGKKATQPLVVARPSTAETPVIITSAEKHQSVSTQVSIVSSGPSSPSFPPTPPIARPRSIDPLSQARRKTRIICGQVIDATEEEEEFCGETAKGHDPDSFSAGSSIQDGAYATASRRGSDRSSLVSSLVHPPTRAHGPSASIVSNYNAYSLNSPIDDGESANVGVALTTEFRELATPSPISFSEQEDARLTLYARRKGRRTEFTALNQPLRVNPPLVPPRSKNSSSVVSPVNTSLPPGGTRTFEGGIILPGAQNESVTDRAISTQPPKQAKRKSFFRYPFSSKRSTGSLRVAYMPTNVEGAPPLASPRAKDPPMSAAANKLDFSPYEVSAGGREPSVVPLQPSAYPVRYPTSRFISFSRPSSSRGKVPVEAGLS